MSGPRHVSSNDYGETARHYALRGIEGSDALAFRTVAERVQALGLAGQALDFGCGSGRSTRFLAALGFTVVGVDLSPAMLEQARRLDPAGDYRLCAAQQPLPLVNAAVDVVLASWVLLEQESPAALQACCSALARVLRSDGRGFIVTNTPEFYAHRWVSCEVDFPENAAPLRSGQEVRALLLPERVLVTDRYWSDTDYRAAFAATGLQVLHAWRPTAAPAESGWLDETRVAPWVIYEVLPDKELA